MKKKLIRKFNDITLRNKLMLSFFGVIFIPILVAGFFLTHELRENALKDTLEMTSTNVERVKKRTDEMLKAPIFISNTLQFDSRLRTLVNEHYTSTFDIVNAYSNYRDFQSFIDLYPSVSNIYFFMNNSTMLNNWSFIPLEQEVYESRWYREAVKANGYIRWNFLTDPLKKSNSYLSLVRKINFWEEKTYGMLVITIDQKDLNSILEQESTLTIMVDEQNYIAAANDKELIGKRLDKVLDTDISMEELPTTFTGTVAGEPSQIIVENLLTESSANPLKIISIVPNDEITKDANRISFFGALLTLIAAILAFFLIMGISWLLSRRLFNLSSQLEKVAAGDLQTNLLIDGNDEIGQLSERFNEMVDNIRQLIIEVEETTIQKNKIENQQNEIKFKMLASQINPHFLFNTFESIRMKAHLNGEKEIANIVKSLGKLMRKYLEIGGQKIRLQEEIEISLWYLEIQKFRFDDRLNFQVKIADECKAILILPLMIQPLVENAVIHGLEGKETGGFVTISVTKTHNTLQIIIKDDGIGMSESALAKVRKTLEEQTETEGTRIGLSNVHQRLILTYGESAGLQITSEQGIGTLVQFNIPWEG